MLDPAIFTDIIKAHLAQAAVEQPQLDRLRSLYQVRQWGVTPTTPGVGRDDELLTESGAVYAYVDSMVSSVVPPNPQVTCVPRREQLAMPAKYREALINDLLKRVDAGAVLWKLATFAAVYPHGVLKAAWNRDRNRPDFLVVDPRHFFFDATVMRWEDIRYAIHVTVLTEAEFAQRVKGEGFEDGQPRYDPNIARRAQFGSFPTWLKAPETGRAEVGERIRRVFQWATVFEVFDFTTPEGRCYHMLEDIREPLFSGDLPYVFVRNPFHMLVFNDNLEDVQGMSDASIVADPVRRLDELRTNKLRFASTSIPITIINESGFDDPVNDLDQLQNQTNPGDIVRLKLKEGWKLDDVVTHMAMPVLNPAFDAMEQQLEEEILFRLGMPQYQRGVTGTSDVATELALVDAALRTRQGRRSEMVNRAIVFMAKAIVGLYEEFLDAESTLPVRLGGQEFLEIARQHLAARNPATADQQMKMGIPIEDPLEIDYVVAPYSPVENNKIAQLKKMREFSALLFGDPAMDQKKIRLALLDALDLPKDFLLATPPAMPMPPGSPPGQLSPEGGLGQLGAQEAVATPGGGMPAMVPAPPGVPVGQRPGMAGGAGFPAPTAK